MMRRETGMPITDSPEAKSLRKENPDASQPDRSFDFPDSAATEKINAETLSKAEQERFQIYASSICIGIEDGKRPVHMAKDIRHDVEAILGSESNVSVRGDAYTTIAEAFFSRLQELPRNTTEYHNLEHWLITEIGQENENIFFEIPVDQLLALTIRIEKFNNIVENLKKSLVDEALIALAEAPEEEYIRLVARCNKLSLPHALDALFLFDKFGMAAMRDDAFGDVGLPRLRKLVQTVSANHTSPIAQIQARHIDDSLNFAETLALESESSFAPRLRHDGSIRPLEEVFPNLQWPEAPHDDPLTEQQSVFRRQLYPVAPRRTGEQVDLVANDAVCVVNYDGLATSIVLGGPNTTVMDYQQLTENKEINPYAQTQESDTALLLQHLHSPALRLRVENDLGIRLRDIPLRSQIHLLRFLADQDASGYGRIRETLHALPDAAPSIAQSFLAFAEAKELGTTVLNTAESLKENPSEAKSLFDTYATFARDVDWEVGQILAIGGTRLQGHLPDRTTIVRQLLHRANYLFTNAEEQLAECPRDQRPYVVEKIVQHFDRETTALRRQIAGFGDVADQLDRAQGSAQAEQYRTRLMVAFRELVLGEKEYQLPEQFFADVEQTAAELRPEQLPEEKPLYFPVGISRDLPAWQEVWEGKAEAAKPIDVYAWLFWMQNQGQPVELVVCDEVQTTNYLTLYPDLLGEQPETAARECARRIGRAERKQYQQIIDTFGLTNIRLVEYDEFRDRHSEKVDRYRTLCTKLADMPMWQEAFLATMKGSQQNSATKADRRALLPYAIEEVALILATRGTKVGHENEAAYDAIAAVLWNVEDYATQHSLELEDLTNNEKLTPAINSVLEALQDRCNTGKSRSTREQPQYVYLEQFRQNLHRILKTAGVANVAGISARSVAFPFACPETGSQSFGWRGKGKTGEEVVVRFKEPYSTYFTKEKTALALESDQIVALPNGDIAGKVLALPQEQQLQYAERVVKPLLAHFYKVLDQVPEKYGYRLGLPTIKPAEIKAEFRSATSLYELIEKIQRYIIVPASREHPTSIIV